MGILSKLFGKKKRDTNDPPEVNNMPWTRGHIKQVFIQPAETCRHQWREIRGSEWNAARYGKSFEVVSEDSWYGYFRYVYHCPLCGGELLVETCALY